MLLVPGCRNEPSPAPQLHGVQRQDIQGEEQPAEAATTYQLEAGSTWRGRSSLLQRADEDAQVGIRLRTLRLERGGVSTELDDAHVGLKLLDVVRYAWRL